MIAARQAPDSAIDADSKRQPMERRILAWMCVLIAVNQLGFGAVIPVLPLYAQSFGVSQLAIGVTVAGYGLSRVLISIPTAGLADRFGRRAALAVGGAVATLGNLWCALAGSYVELLLGRFVAGAGAGIVITAGIIVLADITTPASRGRAMAVYQGVFLFAVGIGPFPGGYLAERFGLDAPFMAYAIASAVAGLVAWFGVAETRALGAGGAGGESPSMLVQMRVLLGRVGLLLVGLVGLIGAAARTGALFSIVPVLASERLLLTPSQIGFGLALGSFVGLAVTYPAGALADRFGRKSVIVPATVLTGVSMLCFGLPPLGAAAVLGVPAAYLWFLLACSIWGGAAAASGAAPAAYAADSAPPGMNAAAMGSYRLVSDLGYVLGPLLLGLVGDSVGLEVPLWLAAALLIGVACLFAAFAPETHAPGRRRAGSGSEN